MNSGYTDSGSTDAAKGNPAYRNAAKGKGILPFSLTDGIHPQLIWVISSPVVCPSFHYTSQVVIGIAHLDSVHVLLMPISVFPLTQDVCLSVTICQVYHSSLLLLLTHQTLFLAICYNQLQLMMIWYQSRIFHTSVTHCTLSFQFGASFLTSASLMRTSLVCPTSSRCQFGARQFGAYSSLTHGNSARFASLARC